jgi:hypothetical protein
VSKHGPLVRVLAWCALGCAGFLAVVGGLALWGPGLVAVGVGGLLAGCTAAGVVSESVGSRSRSTAESAVQAVAWTICGLLVLAGIAALAGGVVAAVGVGATLAFLLIRFGRRRPAAGSPAARPPTGQVLRFPTTPAAAAAAGLGGGKERMLPPVTGLTTQQLGQEWVRTTEALARRLDPLVRASVVLRRAEALDELERRDPDGFTRWFATGPLVTSDPARYVRDRPRLDGPAETDAA